MIENESQFASIPTPILVTGAYGMLGSDLVEKLKDAVGEENVIPTDSDSLDITNLEKVRATLLKNAPKIVINAAAYTNVDKAELERDKAYLINTIGPQNLATACHEQKIQLVHFTTDFVFSGDGQHLWTETDEPNPPKPNYYAETKLWGEREVTKYPENLVLRVQWLYGKRRDRFTILKDKKVFTPFMDQYGAPTSTTHVSRVVVELLAKHAKGLFHFAYDDFTTWADVFKFVKDELNLSTELLPKRTDDANLPAKRPLFGAMSNKKLLDFLGKDSLGSWKDPLRDFLKDKLDN